MKALLLLTILAMASIAALPPRPPKPLLKRRSAAIEKGAGALALLARPLPPPPAKTNLVIAWNYPYDGENTTNNIRFRVWGCRTNRLEKPSTNWTLLGVTSNRQWTNTIDRTAKCYWLSVTATNTVSHLESEFATR